MRFLFLLALLLGYLSHALAADSVCYKVGLIASTCDATRVGAVVQTVPGPQGPPGQEGKSCADCVVKTAALVKRVELLEKDNKELAGKFNGMLQRISGLEENEKTKETTETVTVPPYRYEAIFIKRTWLQARVYCIERGGDLAYHGMKTVADRKKLFAQYKWPIDRQYHMGMSDNFKEGMWRYTDGSIVDMKTVGFRKASNEPNGGNGENFGTIYPNSYELNDVSEFKVDDFICEFPAVKGKSLVYFIYPAAKSWNHAEAECIKCGGHLAYTGFENPAKRSFIMASAGCGRRRRVGLHVGFTDKTKEGTWTDVEGKRSYSRTELQWGARNEGIGGVKENCAMMRIPALNLFDIYCASTNFWFFCQKYI